MSGTWGRLWETYNEIVVAFRESSMRPYMVGSASSISFIIRMDEYNQWLSTQSSPSRHDKL
ncbi:hypothetical protein OROMI_009251 [Orobanche minor]